MLTRGFTIGCEDAPVNVPTHRGETDSPNIRPGASSSWATAHEASTAQRARAPDRLSPGERRLRALPAGSLE